jgi:hypothetical protein
MNFKNVFKQNNRLLVKHDENKIIQNLASRVRRVKSTVIQENKFYEELLKKRKKKEYQLKSNFQYLGKILSKFLPV